MKKYLNKFIPSAPHHIYQRTKDRGILFYSEIDILVLYSIISVCAKAFKIRVHALCFMLNHLHSFCTSANIFNFRGFINQYTSMFAYAYNKDKGRIGTLFDKAGYAPKVSEKDFRSCNNYINNNAPEKNICKKAIDYRWNFLEYIDNTHPYSEEFVLRKARRPMKEVVSIIKDYRKRELPLNYELLRKYRRILDSSEWQQLIDLIIVEYGFIDFEGTISYYNSKEDMLTAADCNLGSEHAINEDFDSKSFIPYYNMIKAVNKDKAEGWTPFRLSEEEKTNYARRFSSMGIGTDYQIKRFLHINDDAYSSGLK